MAWKIERWLADIFPGESQIYAEYRKLPPRELAIVAAAVLDAALAQLLSLRLASYEKEAEAFLGLETDVPRLARLGREFNSLFWSDSSPRRMQRSCGPSRSYGTCLPIAFESASWLLPLFG